MFHLVKSNYFLDGWELNDNTEEIVCYTQSLQFGNAFWLFGASPRGDENWGKGDGKSYLF